MREKKNNKTISATDAAELICGDHSGHGHNAVNAMARISRNKNRRKDAVKVREMRLKGEKTSKRMRMDSKTKSRLSDEANSFVEQEWDKIVSSVGFGCGIGRFERSPSGTDESYRTYIAILLEDAIHVKQRLGLQAFDISIRNGEVRMSFPAVGIGPAKVLYDRLKDAAIFIDGQVARRLGASRVDRDTSFRIEGNEVVFSHGTL